MTGNVLQELRAEECVCKIRSDLGMKIQIL
jgi:hypothetical protein